MSGLSVIIPTLNEAETLGGLLAQLQEQRDLALDIIVADGGSTDATLAIAEEKGAHILGADRGRGAQMNAGAKSADHHHLLFLHSDSRLTGNRQLKDGLDYLKARYQSGRHLAGHFPLSFVTDCPSLQSSLGFFEAKARLNRPGTFSGDQGLMISRSLFEDFGGFSEELPFLEDKDFGERLSTKGLFITLPGLLETSARRFEEEGFDRRIILNALVMGMFHLRSEHFFEGAAGVYREQSQARGLVLAPFFRLVYESLFSEGFLPAIRRIYRLGRYATRNLWQLFLYLGGEDKLDAHDRYAAPLVQNTFGYLLGMLAVTGWFLVAWFGRRQ